MEIAPVIDIKSCEKDYNNKCHYPADNFLPPDVDYHANEATPPHTC